MVDEGLLFHTEALYKRNHSGHKSIRSGERHGSESGRTKLRLTEHWTLSLRAALRWRDDASAGGRDRNRRVGCCTDTAFLPPKYLIITKLVTQY